jgi:hypothetical protein
VTSRPDRELLRRRLDVGRLLTGSLLELGIKAYGASAAASVALSDAETVGGKSQDALAALPNLAERYRAATYVVDHRQEIQAALDYVHEHTPPRAQLEEAADRSSETLRGIETTFRELTQARDAFGEFPPRPDEALGHVRAAWGARPDLDSLADLAEAADQVNPYLDQVEVLAPAYHGGLLTVVDNFASDEIAVTLGVMAVAFSLAVVLGQTVGFWVRRGRPGLIARTLQGLGARSFRRWYVTNLPYALGPTVYAAARERLQRDIAADPHKALDAEVLRELEQYFARRPSKDVGSRAAPP